MSLWTAWPSTHTREVGWDFEVPDSWVAADRQPEHAGKSFGKGHTRQGGTACCLGERLIRGAGEPRRHPVPLGHPSSSPDRIFLAAGRAWQVANILEDGRVTLASAVKSHVKDANTRSRLWSACTGQLGRIHSLWSAEEGYFNTINKANHRDRSGDRSCQLAQSQLIRQIEI